MLSDERFLSDLGWTKADYVNLTKKHHHLGKMKHKLYLLLFQHLKNRRTWIGTHCRVADEEMPRNREDIRTRLFTKSSVFDNLPHGPGGVRKSDFRFVQPEQRSTSLIDERLTPHCKLQHRRQAVTSEGWLHT